MYKRQDWDSLVTSGLKNKFFIAGGLNPENVAAAIQHFPNAYGVDVSSGVETDGIKNLTKIKNFVQNASLASSKQLFIEFLRITKKLNENKIIPYLMGSLAVEQIINFSTDVYKRQTIAMPNRTALCFFLKFFSVIMDLDIIICPSIIYLVPSESGTSNNKN